MRSSYERSLQEMKEENNTRGLLFSFSFSSLDRASREKRLNAGLRDSRGLKVRWANEDTAARKERRATWVYRVSDATYPPPDALELTNDPVLFRLRSGVQGEIGPRGPPGVDGSDGDVGAQGPPGLPVCLSFFLLTVWRLDDDVSFFLF